MDQTNVDEADRLAQRAQMLRDVDRAWLEVLASKSRVVPMLEAYTAELPRGVRKRHLQRLGRQISSFTDATYREAARRIRPEWLPLLLSIARADQPGDALQDLSSQAWGPWEDARRLFKGLIYPILIAVGASIVYGRFRLDSWNSTPTLFDDDFGVGSAVDALLVSRNGFIATVLALACVWAVIPQEHRTSILRWVPVLGRAVRNHTWGRFIADVSRLVRSHVVPMEAVRLAAYASPSRRTRNASLDFTAVAEKGTQPLFEHGLPGLPSLLQQSIHSHEKDAGNIVAALKMLADVYHAQANHRMRWIMLIVFPIGIVLAGLTVLHAFRSLAIFMTYSSILN